MAGANTIWRNSASGYGLVSIATHWVLALSVTGLIGLGMWMVTLSYYHPWYHWSLSFHKAVGMLVFAVALGKFLWRRFDRRPPLEPGLKPYEHLLAHAAHMFLNGFLVVMPVTGYVLSTSSGDGVEMFGLFTLPALIEVSKPVREVATDIHTTLAYVGLGLIVLHAAAAVKHQLLDHGTTLRRMVWPRQAG